MFVLDRRLGQNRQNLIGRFGSPPGVAEVRCSLAAPLTFFLAARLTPHLHHHQLPHAAPTTPLHLAPPQGLSWQSYLPHSSPAFTGAPGRFSSVSSMPKGLLRLPLHRIRLLLWSFWLLAFPSACPSSPGLRREDG